MLAQATPLGLQDATQIDRLLGQIETELHNSLVYHQAIASLQDLLGETADVARQTLAMVGREAARLALHLSHSSSFPADLQEPTTPAAGLAMARQQPGAIGLWPDPTASAIDQIHQNPFDLPDLLVNLFEGSWPSIDRPAPLVSDQSAVGPLAAVPAIAMPLPEADRADWDDSLRAVGHTFQAMRQQLGLNLEQLHARTHIPMKHLQAIESGDFTVLPERVYVRGFVQRMGEALGLDGKAMAASLPKTESVAVVPAWSQRDRQSSGSTVELKPWHLYAGYGVMVASGLAWVSHSVPSTAPQPIKPMILDREAVIMPQVDRTQVQTAPAADAPNLDSFIAPPEATR